MAGRKTRTQRLDIIEKRESSRNPDDEFDPGADLQRPRASRELLRVGEPNAGGPPPEMPSGNAPGGPGQEV